MNEEHPPQTAPHLSEFDPSLVDLSPLREHLAAEHDVDSADVFIERLEDGQVAYGIGFQR